MAGRYFFNVKVGSKFARLGYEANAPLRGGDRGADLVTGGNFYWKLVPHGNNLFSIVNRYECPNNDLCDALLTWTKHGGTYFVTIEHADPALWEITRRPDHSYR